MRFICLLLFMVSCTSCSIFKHAANHSKEANVFMPSNNMVVAHRGAWKKNKLPENSIASLKQAIALKCSGSEFDVRMTADDSLIINHDSHYNKLAVEKSTYAELTAFKLSNEEKLPTLREYILAGMADNKHTKLICEIKPSEISKERGKIVAAKVVQLIKELKALQLMVYISFDYEILLKIIAVNPVATTQYLEGNKSPEQLKAAGINGADYHFSVFQKHPEWIERAKQNNIALNAWTVNDATDMDWLLANGFDFITTNEPELLLERMKFSPAFNGMKLVWSDEFNYKGLLDSAKWNYNIGGNGWGNNELQYYTANDTATAKVENGHLKITARKQPKENREYTSARLVTKNKAVFKYGKIEARVKLPGGNGTWSAIWMLGNNIGKAGWPASGEIDIMEHVGFDKDSIFGTIHTTAYNGMKGTQKVKGIFISNPYSQFHIYSIEWTPEKIDFLLDGFIYNHIANEHISVNEWPFDQSFHLLLNLAIGGNWGGKLGVDEAVLPATMEIDYIRYFKNI